MSSCTVFVFLSLIEYAFVNVMMGDISEVERKDKAAHLRNIIVTTNTMPYVPASQQYMMEQTEDTMPLKVSKKISVTKPLTTCHFQLRKDTNSSSGVAPDGFSNADACPKHQKDSDGGGGNGGKKSPGKKKEPKEIMKKRRERAICIDRVSRVIFPSTFILLNIIYWIMFSEILSAIQSSSGGEH